MNGEAVVLVAEDSLVVRALLRSQLREHGYAVVEAADGEQALTRARESRPDVILLDVEMPRLDGFGTLEALKRDSGLCDTPVIFITGRTTAADAVRGLELGAQDYLRKPFEASELAARVHAALRTKRLQDELRDLNSRLTRQATTDALTGLPNRRALDEELERQCSRSNRHEEGLAILLVDADGLKQINETLGHKAGDDVLVALAGRLASRLRAEDVLGRWGGDEFMVIAPEIDAAGAPALAAALRDVVATQPLDGHAMTVRVGWAAANGGGPEELISRAEAALHAAKDS